MSKNPSTGKFNKFTVYQYLIKLPREKKNPPFAIADHDSKRKNFPDFVAQEHGIAPSRIEETFSKDIMMSILHKGRLKP
jgi:hypothetical protein